MTEAMNEKNEFEKALEGLRGLRIELKNGTTRIVCMDAFLDTTIRLQKQLKLAEKSLEFMAANHEAVRDAVQAILGAPKERTVSGNDAPGYSVQLWTSEIDNLNHAASILDQLAAAKLSQGD